MGERTKSNQVKFNGNRHSVDRIRLLQFISSSPFNTIAIKPFAFILLQHTAKIDRKMEKEINARFAQQISNNIWLHLQNDLVRWCVAT